MIISHHICMVDVPWRGREGQVCQKSQTTDLEVLPMLAEVDEHIGGAIQGGQEVRGVKYILEL
jgi:hypothetical protein